MDQEVIQRGRSQSSPIPNCLCFTVPITEDTKEFVERLKRWHDDPALEPDLEKWYNETYRGLLPSPIVIKSAPKAAKVTSRWKPGKLPKSGFQSVDEAAEWAKATYPHIEWDFEGASIEAINPTISQFHKLAKEYPEVAAKLKYVGTHRGANTPRPGFQWDPNTWAHAARDGSYIGLNPTYYSDIVKFQSDLTICEQSSFHPYNCNSIESVVTHEFGHCVRSWLLESKQAFTRYVSADGFGLVEDTVRLWETQYGKRLSSISRYACEDEHEAWAETFSAMYHSEGKYAIAKKMKTLLKVVADPSKWRGDFTWVMNAPQDEREMIIEELKKLKRMLGIK
ncbi:MAG: hypothetical protein HPY52_10735 [Firmicutes bacterium]|nr:hypothetical protein [Bacillota bacterium]